MQDRIHYTHCPVCGSASISEVLQVKDYSVSNELFGIMECAECTLRFTQDIPDSASIAPYYQSEDYISHTNTSRGVINSMYQVVRKRTMDGKRKLVQKGTGIEKGNLLDVGSGVGTFVHYMKEHGWKVMGLEPDRAARKKAKELYQVELADIANLPALQANQFDAITLWHVLEHVHDLHGYVQQLKALLKEKGKLFIAVPNYRSKDALVYKEFWAAYDVPRHLYHFSPKSMDVLVTKNGMKVESYLPMWFDSFYISLLSSKYKNAARRHLAVGLSKPNLPAAFWNGLQSNRKAWSDVKKCSSLVYVVSK